MTRIVAMSSVSYTAQDHPEAAVMRHPARLARRPAHDHAYARFARSIGLSKRSIALFGLAVTNDWFCRCKGVHKDIVWDTLRLIKSGMLPR